MDTARCVVLMRIKIFTDLLLGWVFRWQSVGIRLSWGGQSSKQRRGQKHFRLRQQPSLHCFSSRILRFLISYLYLSNCVLALPHPTASTTTENESTIMPQSTWCGKRGSSECGGSGACCPSGLTCVRGGVYETSDGLKIVQPICVDLSLIPTQQTIANQPTPTAVTSSLDVTSSPTPTNTATSQTTNDTRNGLALTKEGIIIITSAGSGGILILLIVMFCIGRRRGKREAFNAEKPPSNPTPTNRVSRIPEIRISGTYQCLEAADSEVRRVIPTAELEGESWFPWSRNQGAVHELPTARSVRSHGSLASRVAAALSRSSIYATSTNSDETRTCGNTLAQGLFPARTAAAAVGGGAAMVSQFNLSRPPATLVSATHDSSSSAGQPQNPSQSTHTSKKKHYPVPPLPQLPQEFRCHLPSVPERARLLRTPGLNFSSTSGSMRGAMATQMRWV